MATLQPFAPQAAFFGKNTAATNQDPATAAAKTATADDDFEERVLQIKSHSTRCCSWSWLRAGAGPRRGLQSSSSAVVGPRAGDGARHPPRQATHGGGARRTLLQAVRGGGARRWGPRGASSGPQSIDLSATLLICRI